LPSPGRFQLFYLLHLSQPAADRPIYRTLKDRPVRSIVEFGVENGQRALRMLDLASTHVPANEIRYTGVDLFEARTEPKGASLSLKEAHRQLKATGAKIQLLPGDPFMALSRAANTLTGIDLVVISASQDADALARSWFYLPRMLHGRSQVFLQQCSAKGEIAVRELTMGEIADLAGAALRRQAA
jgi:hypothetical protein